MQVENPRRRLPSVQQMLEGAEAEALAARFGRAGLTAGLRAVLAQLRGELGAGRRIDVPAAEHILALAEAWLAARQRPGLRRTINATGIVLHTNLGRAPLAEEAIAAVADVAAGYANLELDLDSGARGSRTASIEPLLCELTGAEAALVVNNGAAAILLVLAGLAGGGGVVVSRGELVEIGGGFRIPEVIAQGGARLIEVGSTNKTRLADYRAALGPDVQVLLKVHQSNFSMAGFTGEASMQQVAALAKEQGLAMVADLGSGLLQKQPGLAEPTIGEALAAGADVVTCSGDKLLGGPQAGLILGRKRHIDTLRKHPLLRALRLDKMSLAALEATLMLHRDAPARVPVMRMIMAAQDELQARAERLLALAGLGEIVVTEGHVGGGSLPGKGIASRAVALRPAQGAESAAAVFRAIDPPIIARISDGRLLIDVLALGDEELPHVAAAIGSI